MEEWNEYKIGDICSKVCSGGTPSSKRSEYYDGDIPWLNTKEINFNRIYGTEKCITEEGLNNSSAKWIEEDSVIVAMYGATAGKTAIAKIPLTTNQACCNLTIDSSIADYRFVYYYLCYKYVELASLANGGAQQNLNAQIIKDFEISLPSLQEQKQIANILSSLDDKIEVNRRINNNLEQQAQALFKSWFVDFEPFKDQPFVESELGMIPQGWKVGSFSEIMNITSGKRPPQKATHISMESHIPLIGASDIMGYTNNSLYNDKILVIGRVGTHGIIQRFNTPCWPSDNTLVIMSKYYEYCYQFLQLIDYSSLNRGSTQPLITQTDIKNQIIIIPEVEILKVFEQIIGQLMQLRDNNISETNSLVELRDTLLPRLMSGELSVNDIKE